MKWTTLEHKQMGVSVRVSETGYADYGDWDWKFTSRAEAMTTLQTMGFEVTAEDNGNRLNEEGEDE